MAPASTKSSPISSKGQLTLPIEIRHRLGVKPGDRVEFVAEGNRTVIRPAVPVESSFKKWLGALPAFKSREEINAWIADMRDDDEPYA